LEEATSKCRMKETNGEVTPAPIDQNKPLFLIHSEAAELNSIQYRPDPIQDIPRVQTLLPNNYT